MKKRWIVVSTLSAIAALGIYAVKAPSSDEHHFTMLTAKNATIEKQAIAVGQIMPAQAVKIKSQIEGIVDKIYVNLGDNVVAGSPVIKLRPNPTPQELTRVTADLLKSKADLESAKIKLTNLQRLAAQKIIPANYDSYIQAQADVKSKAADLKQKQQELDLMSKGESDAGSTKLTSIIYAPINGTVLDVKVDVGEPITSTVSNQAATEIMTMADMKNIIFKGSVSEHDAAQLTEGMPVELTLAPYPDLKIAGKLTKVAVQSEKLNDDKNNNTQQTQSFDNGFAVEVSDIDFPKDITLRSGFTATAHITLKKAKDVMTVPERALYFKGNDPFVLIADDSAKGYKDVPVKLGLSDGINVEVLSGIEPKQSIIDASMVEGL
ncbi:MULTISPECIES: efflux RND transporter periplasmic adaptor subunit [unclassified Photobacterium]|uniref:efflux RND transporter periplasmic adaptor subunit n=1 Tax=unclassified Photobacterium TaxID=2628852 RepID=UPI001EE051E7|nr:MULTISPECIES: efflux RND transporter periplasmic adaptor subunit [unclassified Photobacterium]MCG3865820.1 efflux RND transporter periplasmic adaptor subunit [Photobacterium sp. Ph6]MCG3877295.1 efflux RND transporter periplasmic adaptor subunit [Photobacterium sp. Ph5]